MEAESENKNKNDNNTTHNQTAPRSWSGTYASRTDSVSFKTVEEWRDEGLTNLNSITISYTIHYNRTNRKELLIKN